MESKPNRLMFVVYEDKPTQELATLFCDEMIRNFWSRCAFDIDWCSFAALEDPQHAAKAATKATRADLIVFSMQPGGELPYRVREWSAQCVNRRSDREGAVIGLLDPSKQGTSAANRYTWLRRIAHQAGLDYLMEAPVDLQGIPNSPALYNERATAVTAVMDSILRQQGTPRTPVF